MWIPLVDPGGEPGAPPQRTQFFRFDMQILQNIAALRSPRPPYEVHAPPPPPIVQESWIRHWIPSHLTYGSQLHVNRIIEIVRKSHKLFSTFSN